MPENAATPELPEWLQPLYPFRTRSLQVGSHRMSFADEGPADAPVCVLLHGNPTWSFLYRDLIGRLRSSYRVIAPDNIGFGLSDKPELAAYHTLGRHVSNFTCLVESLGLRNFALVANGWGGPIGLGYAVAHPDRISRLVLANTWGSVLPHKRKLKPPLGVRLAGKGRLGAWLDSLLNLTMHSMFATRTCRPLSDLALEAYTYPFQEAGTRIAVRAFSRMFYEPDAETLTRLEEIYTRLNAIAAPADILWGEHDPLLGKLPAYLLRDELKSAREPVFLPDTGHYLPEEAPQALAEVLLRSAQQRPSDKPSHVFKILS